MIKNTYQVVDTKDHSVVQEGFPSRSLAKDVRDMKNVANNTATRFIVSRGSEHPRGSSNGINKVTSKRWL